MFLCNEGWGKGKKKLGKIFGGFPGVIEERRPCDSFSGGFVFECGGEKEVGVLVMKEE